jgi:hypothetical protein
MKKLFCYVALISILGISELRAQNPVYPCVNNKTSEENLRIVNASLELATTVTTAAITVAGALCPPAEVALAIGGAIETVITSGLKVILDAFANNTMGKPQPIKINWDLIKSGQFYAFYGSDGDMIQMTRIPGSGQVVFTQDNTWWKGLVAFQKDDTNKYVEMACLQDANHRNDFKMTKELTDKFHFTFSKAKTFGVHTNMYLISNMDSMNLNYDYFIRWVKD